MSKRSVSVFVALALASTLACSRQSNYVVVDDEAEEASTSAASYEFEAPQLESTTPSIVPESKSAPKKPVVEESKSEPVKPVVPPKFVSNGAQVDLTETPNFKPSGDLKEWANVKVLRGEGALTNELLVQLPTISPNLTEFLWSNASLTGDAQDAFETFLAKASRLKKIRLTGLRVAGSESAQFPAFALKALAAAPNLADLDLSGSPLTAAELVALDWNAAFPKLTKINLYQTQIGDDGVKALVPLAKRLTSLNVDDAHITNASIDSLVQFTELTFLHVGRSSLDDSAVAQFANLKKLTKIHITRSAATEDGADKLRQALPSCEVVSQPEK